MCYVSVNILTIDCLCKDLKRVIIPLHELLFSVLRCSPWTPKNCKGQSLQLSDALYTKTSNKSTNQSETNETQWCYNMN